MAPAELPLVAAVAEPSVDDEADDARSAVDDDRDMVPRTRLDQTVLAAPAAFRLDVAQGDFDGAAFRDPDRESLARLPAIVEKDLARCEFAEFDPKVDGQTAAEI